MASPSIPDSSTVADRSLLLTSFESLATVNYLTPVIVQAATATRHSLTIIFFSRLFDRNTISHTQRWGDVQRLLTQVYVHASKVAQDMGRILLDVNVLLKGIKETVPADMGRDIDIVFRASGDTLLADLPTSILSLQQIFVDPATPIEPPEPETIEDSSSTFPVVALGGTFDHLHAGHKILLSMAAWITEEKIIVGVTDDVLLQKKAFHEVLEPLPKRIDHVRDFLSLFKPGLQYDIVPIQDVYGPTGWDPNIQALVVSRETLSGASAIASHRESKHLPPLKTFVIDVISSSDPNIDDKDSDLLRKTKMSSTYIREWIVNNRNSEGPA